MFSLRKPSLVLCLALAISACDTAEDRAQEHFESALELIEAGDIDRALVEFRNVFRLDEDHIEALQTYAGLMQERGNLRAAYRSFLRVAEQQPENIEVRRELALMAISNNDWEEAERHGSVVLAADVDTLEDRILDFSLRYRAARLDDDMPLVRELLREGESLQAEAPDDLILARILLDGYYADQRFVRALEVATKLQELRPDELAVRQIRLQLLAQLEDVEGIEEQLRSAVESFPDNAEAKQALIRFLMAQGRVGDVDTFLQNLMDQETDPEAKNDLRVSYIDFIRRTDGVEPALQKLETFIADTENPVVFMALKASILFDQGNLDDGIALMQDTIDQAEASPRTDQLRVGLARMLITTGNQIGAREQITQVLESDPSNGEALKVRANWLIDEDNTDDAIADLRLVIDQAPEDAAAMTLLARAYQRTGQMELARDMLSLAAEASNYGKPESLRYAAVLVEDERLTAAEGVLIQGLRTSPDDFDLLARLAEVYMAQEDYSRAGGVEDSLRRLDTDVAKQTADRIRLAITARRQGVEGATAMLEEMATGADATDTARLNLIRARLAAGDSDAALQLAEEIVAEDPENPTRKMVLASTRLAAQDFAGSEEIMRDVIDQTGGNDQLWLQLIRVVSAQERADEARALTDQGLERFPNSPSLLWAKASDLEQTNDIDGAIAIYEQLYEGNSNAPIIANNLASLLATYRDDDESLDRAWTVARRLRGTDFAPFQDTYGWIAFRRGEVEEALQYLEPAAEGLQTDPIVQYHLARALEEAGRTEEALAAYQRAIAIAPEGDPRDQINEARSAVDRLAAATSE